MSRLGTMGLHLVRVSPYKGRGTQEEKEEEEAAGGKSLILHARLERGTVVWRSDSTGGP